MAVTVVCPYCTREIAPDARQCPWCGTTYGSETLQLIRRLVHKAAEEADEERRVFDRVPKRYRIVYPSAKTLKESYLANIGRGGVFIRTSHPLHRGARFNLKIHLPDGGAELEVFCEVMWSHAMEWRSAERVFPPGMGVKFLNLSSDAEARIGKLLREGSDLEALLPK